VTRTRSRPRAAAVATALAVAVMTAACSKNRGAMRAHVEADVVGGSAPQQAVPVGSAEATPPPPAGAKRTRSTKPKVAVGAPPTVPPDAGTQDAATHLDLVTIRLLVDPPKRAHVYWGAKDFGLAPLEIRRPRGSGPLDLVLRAPGFLTLHTRVFTDRDNGLSIHLVPEAEAARFSGYQTPAPPPPLSHAKAEPAAKHRPDARGAREIQAIAKPTPQSDANNDAASEPAAEP
jgi:hypothetical protein